MSEELPAIIPTARKTCLFCDGTKRSAEHILSYAVWKVLGAGAAQLEVGIWDGRTYRDFRPPHGQNSFVTRAVCRACNSGWMSSLEVDFLKAVGSMVEPQWPVLADAFMDQARSEGHTIAKWAVKTAITSKSTSQIKRPIHSHIARKLREDALPPDLRVFLGRIEEKGIYIKLNQGFDFVEPDGRRQWKGPEHDTAFDAIFQLNHLAIRAVHGPNLTLSYSTGKSAAPLVCYPPNVGRISPSYNFPDLASFEGDLTAKPMELPPAS